MMPIDALCEIAKRGGSVRWSDGTVTKITVEDSHLFTMVLAKHTATGVEPIPLMNEYDCEPTTDAREESDG